MLKKQAEEIGIELIEVMLPEMPSMEVYEAEMYRALDLLTENGVTHSIFGDIFLQDLREYRETQLKKKDLQAVFPLWMIPTEELIEEFIELNFKAITVCIDASRLGADFCGRIIDRSFVADLPEDVDVCGENGEFHSFVFDAPFFKKTIEIKTAETVLRQYSPVNETNIAHSFYYCDLLPDD